MSLKDIILGQSVNYLPEYTHPWLPQMQLPLDGEKIYVRSTAITGRARVWSLIPFVNGSPVPCNHVSSACPACIQTWHQHWDIRRND